MRQLIHRVQRNITCFGAVRKIGSKKDRLIPEMKKASLDQLYRYIDFRMQF